MPHYWSSGCSASVPLGGVKNPASPASKQENVHKDSCGSRMFDKWPTAESRLQEGFNWNRRLRRVLRVGEPPEEPSSPPSPPRNDAIDTLHFMVAQKTRACVNSPLHCPDRKCVKEEKVPLQAAAVGGSCSRNMLRPPLRWGAEARLRRHRSAENKQRQPRRQ